MGVRRVFVSRLYRHCACVCAAQFYPNGTKQSKQGNVFLLLYLRSTPEISRMSATCRVWLSELDKGREHYKDFNDKNKYTGWRSGLVKTSEIAPLRRMTFQVTISVFELFEVEPAPAQL